MEYRKLGRSDIDVSLICLGTMTWGEQNTEADAHDQLDYALDREVNFIDTAAGYGESESRIGELNNFNMKIISKIPPLPYAITGAPDAIASTGAIPKSSIPA